MRFDKVAQEEWQGLSTAKTVHSIVGTNKLRLNLGTRRPMYLTVKKKFRDQSS